MSDDLLDVATQVIANGCGCDRQCEALVGADVYCGCRVDATTVLGLARSAALEEAAKVAEDMTLGVRELRAKLTKQDVDGSKVAAAIRALKDK